MIEPPVRKDPTDRERSWSYRSPLSKLLDVPFFLCSVVVPCALIFTADGWASDSGIVSKLVPRALAFILLGLGSLLCSWPTNHWVTRLTILGWGGVLPWKQPAPGQQPNALEVMTHQWWGYIACLLAVVILVVTESASGPRQLRLLNGVLGVGLLGAVLKFVCNTIDNTQPTYWTLMCIALFAPLGVFGVASAM